MAEEGFRITEYRVRFVNRRMHFPKQDTDVFVTVRIECFTDDVKRSIQFVFSPDKTLPGNYWTWVESEAGGQAQQIGLIRAFVPVRLYPWYLDLLRNEGDIIVQLDTDTQDITFLTKKHVPGTG